MKDAVVIREMLLERLHRCLRVPSMCGGELGILNQMEYVAFIDERESEWRSYRRMLNTSGAFQATGLHGGFWSATGQTKRDEIQPASIYTRIAYEMGYLGEAKENNGLKVARVLTSNELDALVAELDAPFFESEWTNDDIIKKFGQPSLRWGTNDNSPCILLYLGDASPLRFCYFDCWADTSEHTPTGREIR